MGRNKKSCPLCKRIDSQEMIFCEDCKKWHHFTCVGINRKQAEIFKGPYYCNMCLIKRSTVRQNLEKYDSLIEFGKNVKSSTMIPDATTRFEETVFPKQGGEMYGAKRKAQPLSRTPSIKSSSSRSSSKSVTVLRNEIKEAVQKELTVIEQQKEIVRKQREALSKEEELVQKERELWKKTQEILEKGIQDEEENMSFENSQEDFSDCDEAPEVHSVISSTKPHSIHTPTSYTAHQPAFAYPQQFDMHCWTARQSTPTLPQFSGTMEDWPMFVSAFETSTQRCLFDNVDNMYRLEKALKGEAREIVRSMLHNPQNVPVVIDTLRRHYDRPEQLMKKQIANVKKMSNVDERKLETIMSFSIAIKNLCATMETYKLMYYYNDGTLMDTILEKFSVSMRLKWTRYCKNKHNGGFGKLLLFRDWLEQLADDAHEVMPDMKLLSLNENGNDESTKKSNKRNTRVNAHRMSGNDCNTENKCIVCSDTCKKVSDCQKFKQYSPNERWSVIREKKLCKQCLNQHDMKPPFICKDAVKCTFMDCKIKHHPLVHNQELKLKTEEKTEMRNYTQRNVTDELLFRYIPVVLSNGNQSVKVVAFLDEGSGGTLIEEEVANELRLDGPKSKLCLLFTGESHREESDSRKVNMTITGVHQGARRFTLNNVRTIKSLNLVNQTLNRENLVQKYPKLNALPIASYENQCPRILIGLNNYKLAVPTKVIMNEEGPIVAKCSLGWTVFAGKEDGVQSVNLCNHIHVNTIECIDDGLHELVKKHMSIESLGVQVPKDSIASKEERRALDIMKKTTVYVGDRYETGLLWNDDHIQLPPSLNMAIQRARSLETRWKKDPALAEMMKSQMKDYVSKGYARKLTKQEAQECNDKTWYLPVFPVKNPNKPEKLRMVFDAAATCDTVSLNSKLLKGPDQVPLLLGILLRFRQGHIAIAGDIQEMFHQINVRNQDQDAQRFVWREQTDLDYDTYVLQVLTFGSTCSPSSAQYVKNLNAKRFQLKYPSAVNSIINNHYVDDLLESVQDEEEAIELTQQIIKIHKAGGFNIRNWQSNSIEVLQTLNGTSSCEEKNLNMLDEDKVEKVLGMFWLTRSDSFTYSLRFNKGNKEILDGKRKPTKRELLRIMMSMFDPLGLIANFLSYLKVLLHDIWRSKVCWDDEIQEDHYERWLIWLNALPQLEALRIPRCHLNGFENWDIVDTQMHVFVDASAECCAAVAYLRISSPTQIRCSIVASKTKVAPMRRTSIPRLECVAALIGARLSRNILENLTVKVTKCKYWSDSKTVLSWIRSDTKKIKSQFVAFRIAEIQDITESSNWKYVPTKMNIADVATKWHRKLIVTSEDKWFVGPSFLYEQEEDWPVDITQNYQTNEEMVTVAVHQLQDPPINFERFSKFKTLLRCIVYVLRFINNLLASKRNTQKRIGIPSSEEIRDAENLLWKLVQEQEYLNERDQLLRLKQIDKSSKIYKLSPYLDDYGVLRVHGRIDKIDCVGYDMKRPIILPKNHYVSKLLMEKYHHEFKHVQHEAVVNEMRQKFYIPALRQRLKGIRYNCNVCKLLTAVPRPPPMAPLPKARLSPYTHAFTYTGIDCLGPIDVVVGRRHEKRWICLFTCLTTRAIHLEILYGMDHDSFIMAFENFKVIMGKPREVYTDNGTNFVKAERLLRESYDDVNMNKVAEKFQDAEMKWYFNPPECPHMGGAWERLVRSVKNAFYATRLTRAPTDSLLRNYMMQIQGIINSRPLTYVPLNDIDDEALTPNHFLRGTSGDLKPIGTFDDEGTLLKAHYLNAQLYANMFWKRWVHEYLPELTRQSKWHENIIPLKKNDVVLLVDPNGKRNSWLKGKIEEVFEGSDGHVRKALVKTRTGLLMRPATRLARLDIEENCVLNVKTVSRHLGGECSKYLHQ